MSLHNIPPFRLNRKIRGMSAILLPFSKGEIDWDGFDGHVERTLNAGIVPAVNMDTGFANLIDEATRIAVLKRTQVIASGREFVAGAFVGDAPGTPFNLPAYQQQIESIANHQGLPIIFQSFGLTQQDDEGIARSYQSFGRTVDRFLAFELGTMFAPFGSIYSMELFESILAIKECIGAKHSSLSRQLEWNRLALRDRVRPDFLVLTGNDLAIDMVFYGSDYLLGLSTFAPDLFAKRDALWEAGDSRAIELNDLLQYLGAFAFRSPVPAYKHSAAQFLKMQGWIESSQIHPKSPVRPGSDEAVLREILVSLQRWR